MEINNPVQLSEREFVSSRTAPVNNAEFTQIDITLEFYSCKVTGS